MDRIVESTENDTIINTMKTKDWISKEERMKNLERVQFIQPIAKNIISHHTGYEVLIKPYQSSILSNEDIHKISNFFLSYSMSPESNDSTIRKIKTSQFKDFLTYMGYPIKLNIDKYDMEINEILNRIFMELEIQIDDENMTINEIEISQIISTYSISAINNGHKFRKYCARGQLKDIIEMFIRGCDVNASDGDGLSPLHYASELNQYQVIELLYDLGSSSSSNTTSNSKLSVNGQDKYGWTALHSACNCHNMDAVQKLLACGANPLIGDIYGKTPLHLSATKGYIDIIHIFLDYGVNTSITCKQGKTAAHDAAFMAQLDSYTILSNHNTYIPTIRDSLGNLASDYMDSSFT